MSLINGDSNLGNAADPLPTSQTLSSEIDQLIEQLKSKVSTVSEEILGRSKASRHVRGRKQANRMVQ